MDLLWHRHFAFCRGALSWHSRVMKPDPSSALGLYLMACFSLIVVTGLAHFLAVWVLEQKILAHGFHFAV